MIMKIHYVQNYYAAYLAMKDAAIETMKNYGKTLEVHEVCKQLLMERMDYQNESEIMEDELDDFIWENTYSCVFEGKHETTHITNIVKVRYNETANDVDVYLETDDGYIANWMPISRISFGQEAVYQTILEFVK